MSKKGRRPKARRSLPGSAGPRPPDPALGRAILSGDVSIDEAAAALLRLHAGRPCRVTLAARVAHETSAERMAAIAAEVVRQAPDSLTTLSFGAQADQRTGGPPAGSCPCGSGGAFSRCCGPREAAALRQFSERAGWDELRSAVLEYATRTEDLTDAILDT